MSRLKISQKLLLGRFLTRSGDQAWDFAVPLVLLVIFPDQIRIAALYYFLVRLLSVVLIPKMSTLIDHFSRLKTAKLGIVLQLVGVIITTGAIYKLGKINSSEFNLSQVLPFIDFTTLILGGVLSSLGSTFMDIAIANDLVPSTIKVDELAAFNSKLRQVDLFTEVMSPVLAGLLLLLNQPFLFGFFLIALWNIISFFPELSLLSSVFKERPDLLHKKSIMPDLTKKTLLNKLSAGWAAFFKQPIALAAVAYAFLWLSVLSPHGVLLSAFLKDGWHLPEWLIGSFRGAGAFFGLLSTILFPIAVRKLGLLRGTYSFIWFQAIILLIGLILFFIPGYFGQLGFLACILLSRIGLYGFSQGEMQIRQVGINPSVRGEVNGFANALTGVATLFLYGAGALLPSTDDFQILVIGSVVFIVVGAITYSFWLRKNLNFDSNPKIN